MTENNPVIYIYNINNREFLPKLQIRCVSNITYHEVHLRQLHKNGRMEFSEKITNSTIEYVEKIITEIFGKYSSNQKHTFQMTVDNAKRYVKFLLAHLQIQSTRDV